jgi:hypothetical protein
MMPAFLPPPRSARSKRVTFVGAKTDKRPSTTALMTNAPLSGMPSPDPFHVSTGPHDSPVSGDLYTVNEKLTLITDPNGAYMETPNTLPTLRIVSMGVLGLFMGAGLMLIGASLSKAGVESAWPSRENTARASQPQIETKNQGNTSTLSSKTIFPTNVDTKENFYVFSMPMKIQRVASTTETVKERNKDASPPSSIIKRIKPQMILRTPEVVAAAGPMSRRSVCVRMCDGYYFPLGNLDARSDTDGQEAMCKAACPGTTTKLFTIPSGGEGIDQAVSPQGKSYRSIPMAYVHESGRDETCSCRVNSAKNAPIRVALMDDPTLRPGDAMVIDGQAKVFTGKVGVRNSASDFSDFRTTRTLSPADRQRLDQMVGVSRQETLYRQIQSSPRVRDTRATAAKNQQDKSTDSVRIVVRAGSSTGERTTVRIVTPSPFTPSNPFANELPRTR